MTFAINIVANFFLRLKPLSLATRLFFSHLLVAIVTVSFLVIVGKAASPILFARRLEAIEAKGFDFQDVRSEVVEGFDSAWHSSTLWSVIVGTTAAGVLSLWVARRITKPMIKIERVIQQFARGKLSQRLPPNDIPELNRLSTSFNHMASSLEGVEQHRRELIGDLTHELRTPLTIIYGYLEGITATHIEATPEVYERLMKETKRLQRLVNDLQELSKAEAGYLTIHLAPINLYPLLSALVERFAAQILEDLTIRLECPPTLPLVLADLDRLEQVLVNLLGNAVSYTEAGSIALKVWQTGKRVWLEVRDTGVGIAPEDLPHVFERFWRSERAIARQSRGSGIGLAISRHLVELQGGKIEVESELGKGSTFRFSLVVADLS
ncbi:cell wall metabolism sensor histidine kinase WalK [Myxosarcina sp. GI1]|uniref:sensor histidine kinase n=1 Tax=Myxosarcina sp. GI1 TaxID=1541065 RepID=UPI0020A17359|nr:HAMP domain-containing sensor histidine kinase [Myxosarcina sp. GI1]